MAPRILVFGTGSVGAVYAYLLSRAVTTENVFTICRSNYAVASSQGFTIHSTLFGENLNFRPRVAASVEEAVELSEGKPFDYIVMTAKAVPTTPSLPEIIRPAVSAKTTIALIQNGIGIEEPYSSLFPDNPILSCVVYLPATQTSPGVISHREVERLHIGAYPSSAPASHHEAGESFRSLLRAGGATATVHADVQSERWSKLLVNAAWNPTCALSLSRDMQFLHSAPPYALAHIESLMLEIATLAGACGYPSVNADTVAYQIGRAKARSLPGIEPSMLADAKGRRRMEVDAIVGNAVRIAEDKGVPVPLLRATYALVKALDESFKREPPSS